MENYVKENCHVYDRFTFDYLFKKLLAEGYDNEDAKDIILCTCALSALVMQERIYNKYYLEIYENDTIAKDLRELQKEIFSKAFLNRN